MKAPIDKVGPTAKRLSVNKPYTPEERITLFWSRVDKTSSETGCWLWTAMKDTGGYGTVSWNGKMKKSHRISYLLTRGEVSKALTLDHLCRNRACVNPDHLEPVTMRVNALRGFGASAQNAKRTHCKHGHELSGDNLAIYQGKYGEFRQCRICTRKRAHLWTAKARRNQKIERANAHA